MTLLLAQALGAAVTVVWSALGTWVVMKAISRLGGGINISPAVEHEGLDLAELGARIPQYHTAGGRRSPLTFAFFLLC